MEMLKLFLGQNSFGYYLVAGLFSLLGFAVHKYLSFRGRTVKKPFSFKYFLKDNVIDLVAGAIITYLFIRFGVALAPMVGIPVVETTDAMLPCLLFGFFYTSILELLRNGKFASRFKSSTYVDGTNREL